MRLRAALVLLLLGCATAGWRSAEPLGVMTFNIRLNLASDGVNAWPNRKEAVARIIRDHRADLVGLQEALPEQLADLDRLLPQFGRFGVGRASNRTGEHSAILYRKDRFEVVEHDTFWLSETPEIAGTKGWDAAYERIVTWGKLRDRQTGQTFLHFNTHLDHVGVMARREGTRLLLSNIDRIAADAPTILTGDFNATPESEPYRLVIEHGLRDALIASADRRGPDSTWNAFKAIEPGRRIDFIFVRGAEVLEHEIVAETVEGRFPSDHLPVMARIRVRPDLR
jgi:endonuclease/exonuclease/phosphatase family metal-dependent hydrolase